MPHDSDADMTTPTPDAGPTSRARGHVPADALPEVGETKLRPLPADFRGRPDPSPASAGYDGPSPSSSPDADAMPHEDGTPAVDPDAPASEAHVSRKAPIILAVLILLLAGVGVYASYALEVWGGRTVPDVSGQSQAEAQLVLEAKGFSVTVESQPTDDAPGAALSTNPPAGSRMDAGSPVTVYVGVARTIPDVLGKNVEDAKAALMAAGAQNIAIQTVFSDKPENTVVDVDPKTGNTFSSGDTVTLTVAKPFAVPQVVGKTQDEATKAIKDAGLKVQVVYAASDKPRGTVASCDPAGGTKANRDTTVTITVSAVLPTDYHHLMDYYQSNAPELSYFMAQQGFTLASSYTNGSGHLEALYTSTDKGTIVLTDEPYSHDFAADEGGTEDLLRSGTAYAGIRLEFPAADLPSDASSLSDAALQQLVTACGLSGQLRSINQDSIVLPPDVTASGQQFVCAYGEMGDYCWTVEIANEDGGTRATATVAPKSLYASMDLSPYGGNVCDMIAYYDTYTA